MPNQPDPEEVVRMIAQLRHQHPHGKLSKVCDLIDWPALRYTGETREAYAERMHGPLVVLVYCTVCNKTHAVTADESPCAPGAWLDPEALR